MSAGIPKIAPEDLKVECQTCGGFGFMVTIGQQSTLRSRPCDRCGGLGMIVKSALKGKT